MPELWVPIETPPQVSEQALDKISSAILRKGLRRTSLSAYGLLEDSELLLGEHIDQLGDNLIKNYSGNVWPKDILNIGAGLAWMAYRETGYYQSIDDGLSKAERAPKFDDVLKDYIANLACDQSLFLLTDIACESEQFVQYGDIGLRKILDVGAGCVRYYLEQALAVA